MSGPDVVFRAVGPIGATGTGDDGWFAVDALRREFAAWGIGTGAIVEQEYDGKPHRVVFAREPHGVCSRSTQPVE